MSNNVYPRNTSNISKYPSNGAISFGAEIFVASHTVSCNANSRHTVNSRGQLQPNVLAIRRRRVL
jgi:hypothetical protein